jgi:hypothetical protein
MPLNKHNTRVFHRRLYSGILESVTLKKRNDDQQAGTVRSIRLHQVRWSRTFKTGEPIAGDVTSSESRTLHIPRVELDRVGVAYINSLDRFVDEQGGVWQPESTTTITVKLFLNHLCVACLRVTA